MKLLVEFARVYRWSNVVVVYLLLAVAGRSAVPVDVAHEDGDTLPLPGIA